MGERPDPTTPSLVSLCGAPAAASFFSSCKRYYESAPWRTIKGSRGRGYFEIHFGDAPKETTKVVQLIGVSNRAFGLRVFDDHSPMNTILRPGCDLNGALCSGKAVQVFFQSIEEMVGQDYTLARRGQLPVPQEMFPGDNRRFPNVTGFTRRVSRLDLRYAQAALEACVALMGSGVHRERDVYGCHSFDHAQLTLENGDITRVRVSCGTPRELAMDQQQLGQMPQMIMPVEGASDPIIAVGVRWYSQQRARTQGYEQMTHTYGLANALWKLNSVDKTKEAIKLGEMVLRSNPNDNWGVRYFLLDLYLEVCDGEGGYDLLCRFEDESSCVWFWSGVLVAYLQALPEGQAARLKGEGNKLFASGRWADAADKYDKAIAVLPSHVLYGNRAACRLQQAEALEAGEARAAYAQQAVADAERATSLDGGWSKGWARWGNALVLLGRSEEAVGVFRRGLALPDIPASIRTSMEAGLQQARDAQAPATTATTTEQDCETESSETGDREQADGREGAADAAKKAKKKKKKKQKKKKNTKTSAPEDECQTTSPEEAKQGPAPAAEAACDFSGARARLKAAHAYSPYVIPLLLGLAREPEKAPAGYSVKIGKNGIETSPAEAQSYVHGARRHWPHGALAWLRREWDSLKKKDKQSTGVFRSKKMPILDLGKCAHCGDASKKLKSCSRCNSIRYCSPACQRADWAGHKHACSPAEGAAKSSSHAKQKRKEIQESVRSSMDQQSRASFQEVEELSRPGSGVATSAGGCIDMGTRVFDMGGCVSRMTAEQKAQVQRDVQERSAAMKQKWG